MKRPERMKYQKNSIGYLFLLLYLLANLVYVVYSLQKNKVTYFVGIDTTINIAVSLTGFLAAVRLQVYDRKWSFVAIGLGLFQFLRIMTIQRNTNFDYMVMLIALVVSGVFGVIGGLITIKKGNLLEKVKAGLVVESKPLIREQKIETANLPLEEKTVLKETDKPSKLSLRGINKIYPNGVQAVFNFNLEIEEGDFIVLVGPSGCGKSTTLRMVSGLESISSGDLILNGKRINNAAPSDRDIAMIFQDYALYGHMTVYDNMGFSLKVRKEKATKIHDEVMGVSKIVKLDEQLNRLPKNLSGGQRQRVALGRSIVRDAEIFLMDEPLSNLDAKLRDETRKEIIKLHHDLNATIIYVTHDQIEAMAMATKIVVMNDGYVQQIGTPMEVYHKPENIFVATFIGAPTMNLLEGKIEKGFFTTNEYKFKLSEEQNKKLKLYENKEVTMGIRPQDFSADFKDQQEDNWCIKGKVDHVEFQGATTALEFLCGDKLFDIAIKDRQGVELYQELKLSILKEKVHFFDTASGLRIKEAENQITGQLINGKLVDEDFEITLPKLIIAQNKLKENHFYKVNFREEEIHISEQPMLYATVKDILPCKNSQLITFGKEESKIAFRGHIHHDLSLKMGEVHGLSIDLEEAIFTEMK